MRFLQQIRLSGLLSFAPDFAPLQLEPLNVLIGPNGSGKSNLIEAIEILRAAPTGLAAAVRAAGGIHELLWKGEPATESATIESLFLRPEGTSVVRHQIEIGAFEQLLKVIAETIEEPIGKIGGNTSQSFFRVCGNHATIGIRDLPNSGSGREHTIAKFSRSELESNESVLSQVKGPALLPEMFWIGKKLQSVVCYRDWNIGSRFGARQPQPADLPTDVLLPDASNLGLILNEIEHAGGMRHYNDLLREFLPRFERVSVRIIGGTVQIYLHEEGLRTPIPATRISDGTLRFMAILAVLLSPNPPPLVCMEEPEIGLHPDAAALVAKQFAEAARRMQLIVTTHSDAFVSALTDHAESVVVCEQRNGTYMRRVDSAELQHWLNDYRLGEIWRIGELGGNP